MMANNPGMPWQPPYPRQGPPILLYVLLCIIGGLGFVGWRAASRFGLSSSINEVRNALPDIARMAARHYNEHGDFCPSAAPVPADDKLVRGKEYQSSPPEWRTDPGWHCMRYEHSGYPQRYQYRYDRTPDGFVVVAYGDLDGDRKVSTFRITAHLEPGDGDAKPRLVVDPNIAETNPGE